MVMIMMIMMDDVGVGGVAAHLIADRGACVHACPPGSHSNDRGKCVRCSGPCPKRESTMHTHKQTCAQFDVKKNTSGSKKVVIGSLCSLAYYFVGNSELTCMQCSDTSLFILESHTRIKVKVKFSHTRYRALGPELIPVYSQPAGDLKPSTWR